MGADVIIVMMLFMVFGIILGYGVGQILGKRAQDNRQYWVANALLLGAGILISALSALSNLIALVSLSLGLIAGGVTGIKFGYGRSVGIWRRHDRMFRVSADQLKADDDSRKAASRDADVRNAAAHKANQAHTASASSVPAEERELVSVGPRTTAPQDSERFATRKRRS